MKEAPLVRILGLDYGEKRIGVAVSDPLGIAAHPWGMVPRSEEGRRKLRALVDERQITTIIMGMPLTLKGERGPKAQEVEQFMATLKRELQGVEFIEWDERFTTTMAQQTLRSLESKKSRRSDKTGRVDAMAAAVLLQSFLDSTKHSRSCSTT